MDMERKGAEMDLDEITRRCEEYEMMLFNIIRTTFILPLGKAMGKSDGEIADKVFEVIEETRAALKKEEILKEMQKSATYREKTFSFVRPMKEAEKQIGDWCAMCVRKGSGACAGCVAVEHPSGRVGIPSHFLAPK